MSDPVNIVFVYSDGRKEWNCTQWRCVIPSRALRKKTNANVSLLYIQDFIAGNELAKTKCEPADVIFIQRNLFQPTQVQCIYWMLRGKKFIVDIDDAYHYMNKTLNAYPFWHEGIIATTPDPDGEYRKLQYTPLEQLQWGVKLVGNLSSPNELILEDWSKYKVNTIFIPNYIESSKYKKHMRTEIGSTINLGWGGSLTHYISFTDSGVMRAITRVLKRHSNVNLLLTTSDQRVVSGFSTVASQIKVHGWTLFHKWPKLLSNTDIGIVPLSGKYDQRRSWIKPLELACMGIPWIASEIDAYKVIPGGKFSKNTANWWEEHIEDMISNIKTYKEKSVEIANHMEAFDAYEQADSILEKLTSILGETNEDIDCERNLQTTTAT